MNKERGMTLVKQELRKLLIDLQDEVYERADKSDCIADHLKRIKEIIKDNKVRYDGYIFPDVEINDFQ